MTVEIILASASPRRSELLKQIGIRHTVCAVDIDETPHIDELPMQYVERMASEKSARCQTQFQTDKPILAADTTVVFQGQIMGKPENLEHAIHMLTQLSGKTHQVLTAVSLRCKEHAQVVSISEVSFKILNQSEILAYWQTGEPLDKAGAYGIQGLGSIFVKSITGSYSGVMGLPLFETAQLLAQQGISIIA